MTPGRESDEGFAILAALWFVVLLSGLALAVGADLRTLRLGALGVIDRTTAWHAAAAGLELGRFALVEDARRHERAAPGGAFLGPHPWTAAGRSFTESVGDARADISLRDLDGLLNVNLAAEGELRLFLEARGLPYREAAALAASIADWRDPDDLHRAEGAERDWYVRKGAETLPPNRPLEAVGELRGVRGMTEALLDELSPELTVVGDGRVNVNTAPLALLATLPGFTAPVLHGIRAARGREVHIRDVTGLLDLLDQHQKAGLEPHLAALMVRLSFETERVWIRSEGWAPGSALRVVEERLLERGGGLVSWQEGARASAP